MWLREDVAPSAAAPTWGRRPRRPAGRHAEHADARRPVNNGMLAGVPFKIEILLTR
jgi:hypothetical protein